MHCGNPVKPPPSLTKVTILDTKALASQNTAQILAVNPPQLGILKIEGKNQKKPATRGLFTCERSVHKPKSAAAHLLPAPASRLRATRLPARIQHSGLEPTALESNIQPFVASSAAFKPRTFATHATRNLSGIMKMPHTKKEGYRNINGIKHQPEKRMGGGGTRILSVVTVPCTL